MLGLGFSLGSAAVAGSLPGWRVFGDRAVLFNGALSSPSLSGRHSGLAWGWDGFSEPCEAEPFPLALSLWQLWQLCGHHCAGSMTLKVISY